MIARLLVVLFAVLLVPAPAAAHTRSQSFSSWAVDGSRVIGVFQSGAYRVTQLGDEAGATDLDALLARHLAGSVHVSQAGRDCRGRLPRSLVAARGDVRVELVFDCDRPLGEVPALVVMGAFFDVSPSHVHYARVAVADGSAREVLATVRSHSFEVGARAAAGPTDFPAFFHLGLEHVLSGIDHIAFLIALALLAAGLGRAVWAATGFTVGHSLTLGLVALGWLSPDTRAVEALIGFTVTFAAGEAFAAREPAVQRASWITLAVIAALPLGARVLGASLLPWMVVAGVALFALCAGGLGGNASRRLAPLLAAAFGLAHGAGFAGALIELDIPRERLLVALLGFNVGVEAAQIVALLVVALVALLARRLPALMRRRGLDYATVSLFALGVYWFVGRAIEPW